MNTIAIEFCPEDRKRIDELIAFAGLIASELKSRPATAPVVELPADPEPADPEGAPAPAPEPEAQPISLAEFQKAVTIVCAQGQEQKAAAKEIINQYAASVSEVPEDKRAEILAALNSI